MTIVGQTGEKQRKREALYLLCANSQSRTASSL